MNLKELYYDDEEEIKELLIGRKVKVEKNNLILKIWQCHFTILILQ